MTGAKPRIRLVAHRGLSGRHPENTLAAFRAALEAGACAVEFDVQQTRDGALAVIHDTELKRLAGVDSQVGALSWAELSRLDVGRGERVPSLAQVMELVGGLGEIHLEIKQPAAPYPGIEERVLALLGRERAWKENTIISSFDFPTLERVRRLDPSARLGWLAGRASAEAEADKALRVGAESLHISLRRAGAEWMRAARSRRLKVLVYTPNTEGELKRLEGLGVYGAFTDFCDLRREALR